MKLLIPSLLALFFVACDNGSSTSATSSLSDAGNEYNAVTNTLKDYRNGQIYKTVTIGTQIWMAENLNYETENSYCYNDNAANCTKYGRLYTWAAAMDSAGTWSSNGKDCGYKKTCTPTYPVRGVCPAGWHLPSKNEWEKLFMAVGGQSTASKMLKSALDWSNNGNGTDDFLFSALPGGYRFSEGDYFNEGYYANFWSSTEYGSYDAYCIYLYYGKDNAFLDYDYMRDFGLSVRCLKD